MFLQNTFPRLINCVYNVLSVNRVRSKALLRAAETTIPKVNRVAEVLESTSSTCPEVLRSTTIATVDASTSRLWIKQLHAGILDMVR